MLNPTVKTAEQKHVSLKLSKQFGWYDFTIRVTGHDVFERRYAGRVETGRPGFSDPYMGRIV
jgi:phospholipase C